WTEDWHNPFIDMICASAVKDFPHFDPQPLRQCQAQHSFDARCLDFYQTSMEAFSPDKYDGFDVTYSSAVLEHIASPQTVTHTLQRVTKPGGFGMHIIDLRDHRDFSAPLEYLLLSDDDLEAEAQKNDGPYWLGNPLRLNSWLELWEQNGFRHI